MNLIVVFAKMPVPGKVKTRLCPPLTPEQAAVCYQGLARDVWSCVIRVPEADALVALDPAGAAPDPSWLAPGARWTPQTGEDLGARLGAAFAQAFSKGASKVLIVGSDIPELAPADLRDALAALDRHDLVLGPAADGGYYLVGLKTPCAALFEGISWSGPQVLAQTSAAARRAGLSAALLKPLADIDTFSDLKALTERGLGAGLPLVFTREALRAVHNREIL